MNSGKCPAELQLPRLISKPRFATYRGYLERHPSLIKGRDLDILAKRLYMWDISVAAALWPSVSIAEVVLRNAMNDAMCAHFQVKTEEGWYRLTQSPSPRLHLLEGHLAELERDVRRLRNRLNREPTGDEIVGGLSLGIWGSLLDRGDNWQPKYHYEVLIWRAFMQGAFPRYQGTRKALRDDVRRISKLRNRIAHHEPLLRSSVPDDIEHLATLVSYIDTEMGDYLRATEGATWVFNDLEHYLDGECFL